MVLCSLFAHHLPQPVLVRFMRWLDARAERGWLISDLHRHPVPWAVVWAGVLYLITSWLWLLLIVPGFIAWGLISLWFLYRIVKGMARMNAGRAMEASNVL